jgi:hypothetical protein
MTISSAVHELLARSRRLWTRLERGWQAVVLAYLVVALIVLAP